MFGRIGSEKPRAKTLELPPCITAPVLVALARTLEKLTRYHYERGGADVDVPCIKEISVEDTGRVFARISSGERTYRMELVSGGWLFV